jgi:ribose transport system permease protein
MARLIGWGRNLIAGGGPVAVFILLGAMFVVYAFHEHSALSLAGMTDLLNNAIVLTIAASGLTLVVLCGEIDLSGPGVIAVVNVMVASTSTGHLGWVGSLIGSLAIGAAVGALNGGLIAYLGQQSLAVTLGSLIVCQGAALLILPAQGGEVPEVLIDGLTGTVFGFPVPAILLAAIFLLWSLLRRSALGIRIYAVGADPQAARLSGVDVATTRLFAFVASGICYSFAGFVHSAEIGSGDPRVSDSLLLFMFAAVSIGGTALSGGRGGVTGTLAGACVLSVLQKMLFSLGVADFYTYVFDGLILVLAICFGQASTSVAAAQRERAA